MLNSSLPPWPSFTGEEADAITGVLRSNRVNYWTGDETRAFEREYAAWTGVSEAVAMMNGTVALEACLHALGVGPGDEVIVTPRTFLASVACVVRVGAVPVFADIDRDNQGLSTPAVELVISERTRAIIPVHLGGHPCDLTGLLDLGVPVIEDCAQAHGAKYRGRPVGSIGRMGAWSFCQDKIITTGGEGGMVTTDDHELWSRVWSLKDHGKSFDAVQNQSGPPGTFRWLHESFGSNFRMTEMQGAIGRIQLGKVDEWHAARARNAGRLIEAARRCPGLRVPVVADHVEHAWYRGYLFVRPGGLKEGWSRDRILAEIIDRGIPCGVGSCSEVYLEKAFDGTGFRPEKRLPVAKELGETSMAFLVHPTLTDDDMARMCSVLTEVMRLATR